MNYLLCAIAYGATIAVIIYGFSKLRRTCPTCKGTGRVRQRTENMEGTAVCHDCIGEGKL
jgi:hypothetical protein